MYCVSIVYILNYDTSKYRLNTYHNTYRSTTIHWHAKYIMKVLACIDSVFGMYEIMIRANTDQIHAFLSIRANMDANTFTNMIPIQSSTVQHKH